MAVLSPKAARTCSRVLLPTCTVCSSVAYGTFLLACKARVPEHAASSIGTISASRFMAPPRPYK